MQTVGVINVTSLASGGATTHRRSQPVSAVAIQPPPPSLRRRQRNFHPMHPKKVEVFKSLESWATKDLLPLLKPVEKSWQPTDFLPDPTKPINDFMDEVRALRDRANRLPDEYFVVLVGDMLTEEALPTYQTMLNTFDVVRDQTGSSLTPRATWIRAWTAEENRHGDLLKTYLYLTGPVDMLMIEKTLHYLISNGMDAGLDNNPYLGFVYTSFQERATFVLHGNTARLAKEGGDTVLANICGTIAADEKLHENAYIKIIEKLLEIDTIIEKLLEIDTNEAMISIGKMMRKKITMPVHLMTDGQDPHLFEHFSFLSHKTGVYDTDDYVEILEFLIGRWILEKLEGLNGDARREQDFVCSLGPKIRKLNVQADERAKNYKGLKFSWIFNREVNI